MGEIAGVEVAGSVANRIGIAAVYIGGGAIMILAGVIGLVRIIPAITNIINLLVHSCYLFGFNGSFPAASRDAATSVRVAAYALSHALLQRIASAGSG